MTGIWLISYLALWFIVFILLLLVVTLARQIGLLHRRLAPTGAMMTNEGLEIGKLAPEVEATDFRGRRFRLGIQQEKAALLVFISPTCGACSELAPALRSIWKGEQEIADLFLVSIGGDQVANAEFITRHKLGDIPYFISQGLGVKYKVMSPPYALLIDKEGVVRAKGIVNHFEHLESLLNAEQIDKTRRENFTAPVGGGKRALETGRA